MELNGNSPAPAPMLPRTVAANLALTEVGITAPKPGPSLFSGASEKSRDSMN